MTVQSLNPIRRYRKKSVRKLKYRNCFAVHITIVLLISSLALSPICRMTFGPFTNKNKNMPCALRNRNLCSAILTGARVLTYLWKTLIGQRNMSSWMWVKWEASGFVQRRTSTYFIVLIVYGRKSEFKIAYTETEMSFWRNFLHWLHRKLWFWQHPVYQMTQISSKWHFLSKVESVKIICQDTLLPWIGQHIIYVFQWNKRHGVSNPRHCHYFNTLFRLTTNKTAKLCIIGHLWGELPVTGSPGRFIVKLK